MKFIVEPGEVYKLIQQGLRFSPLLSTGKKQTESITPKTPERREKVFLTCLNLSIKVCSSPLFPTHVLQ